MEPTTQRAIFRNSLALVAAAALCSCSSMPATVVQAPYVSLNSVEVQSLAVDNQTVLLGFGVTNPNPFPLPVESLSYGVKLDGYRFASGHTQGDFTVPAQSDSAFAIQVELDLLRTAPRLIHIVREGSHRDIPYALQGELEVDVPFAPPVEFRNEGTIRLFAQR